MTFTLLQFLILTLLVVLIYWFLGDDSQDVQLTEAYYSGGDHLNRKGRTYFTGKLAAKLAEWYPVQTGPNMVTDAQLDPDAERPATGAQGS